MSRLFTQRGPRPEPLSRYTSARIYRRGSGTLPSASMGIRWRALPVHGSKAWRERQPLLSRLLGL